MDQSARQGWRAWPDRHARLFRVLVIVKRLRTKVGLAVAAWCLIEGILFDEVPFDLARPNAWVVVGLILVATGIALRFAAHGSIRKHEQLATTGVYSLCRHPLYLGSMLLTYGFCCLLDDGENWAYATAYFAVFYPLTIAWEEIRLADRYGEAHGEYRRRTPLLIPFGRFRADGFSVRRALSTGGGLLLAVTALLLGGIETMYVLMRAG
jgi:protein-S-isoprenylcysteine O-methyltransferase Ste14